MTKTENIGFGDLKLIQDPEGFCYGVDAVILADFACSCCPQFSRAVDLGTGTGIVPFILSHKSKSAEITGIELQQSYVDMAQKACLLNGLEERVTFFQGDVKDIATLTAVQGEAIDFVTCNPPYVAKGSGLTNENHAKFVARHETTAELEDFVKAAATLLKGKGHFFMVHRPSRLVDIFYSCRKHRLEPKEVRLVAPKKGETANIVLVHCVADGGRELKLLKELYVYDESGEYSEEIDEIYERRR